MGLTKPYNLNKHGEGHAHLVECVNATRVPLVRKQILEGKFHSIYSKTKKRFVTVEKKFFYSDFSRHQYFLVRLPSDRGKLKEANKELAQFMRDIPGFISPSEKQFARVVFGLDELRERLVAYDAKLDGTTRKKIKMYLLNKHKAELKKIGAVLFLVRATKVKLFFRAQRGEEQVNVSIPIRLVHTITGAKKAAAVPKKLPSSLETLKDVAGQLRKNGNVEQTPAFRAMLKMLPKGTRLPKAAQQDLEEIFNWAVRKKMDKLEDVLFEIRFDTKLEKAWSENRDEGDIGRLWKLLEELPDSNVEGNTALDEISLDIATGGGTFDPNTHDIAIGDEELSNAQRFPDVVRHEVGHAVHEMKEKLVNDWLKKEFGWEMLDPTDRNIDKWAGRMQGWKGITAKEKAQVRAQIKASLGKGGSWTPPKRKVLVPRGHCWYADDFGPRQAVEYSQEDWFKTNEGWYCNDGKAFFLNYWYGTLSVVNCATLDFINKKMPDQYAAMSPLEFFAEVYALYFSHDQRKRKKLAPKVISWMAKNIGKKDSVGKTSVKNARKAPQSGQRGGRMRPQSGVDGGRHKSPQSGWRGGRLKSPQPGVNGARRKSPKDGGRGG